MNECMAMPVIVERDGPLLILTLNRPKRMNAFTGPMLAILTDSYAEADTNPDIRAIIITGAEGNFSSGADLRAMAGDADDDSGIDVAARIKADPELMNKGFLKTQRPGKPIIAAVEGVAIAGGTEILLGTDIRVAGETARFGVSEARWALYPRMGSAVRLPRQIPMTAAAEILLTAGHITAQRAFELGLVGSVVPAGTALERAKEIGHEIAGNGPIAVAAILKTIRETGGLTEEEGFAHEDERADAVFRTEDAKEGPRAFAEKRKPNFQGR